MLDFRRFVVVGLVTTIFCSCLGHSVAAKKRSVIRRLSFDPSARVVKLFEGMKDGQLSSRVAVKNETTSTVFINNETDEPLTVELPPAVAAVHVLKQVLPQTGGGDPPNQQAGGGNGASQAVGGQFGQGNQAFTGGNNSLGDSGFNQGGGGLFSIPPEATVALKLNSVCLEHGKKNPTIGMKYELRPIEVVAKNNADLIHLLSQFDPSQKHRKAVQAAAWHLSNKMSWDELKTKQRKVLGQPVTQWFAKRDIDYAQKMVARARTTVDKANRKPISRTNIRTANTAN